MANFSLFSLNIFIVYFIPKLMFLRVLTTLFIMYFLYIIVFINYVITY